MLSYRAVATTQRMTDTTYDPNRRQRYAFSRAGEDLVVEIEVAPGGDGPLHFHPEVEERWTVVDGRVRFRVGRRRVVPDPGEELIVPPGTRHSFKNVGDGAAHLRAVVSPASEVRGFLEEAAALARAGCYTRRGLVTGPRGAIRMAEFLERYRDVAVILWPPRPVQRLLAWFRRAALLVSPRKR